jgi:hypothetical protein
VDERNGLNETSSSSISKLLPLFSKSFRIISWSMLSGLLNDNSKMKNELEMF